MNNYSNCILEVQNIRFAGGLNSNSSTDNIVNITRDADGNLSINTATDKKILLNTKELVTVDSLDDIIADKIEKNPALVGKHFIVENKVKGEIFNDYRPRSTTNNLIQGNIASGKYSHAEGEGTVAEGDASHTEGGTTIAEGMCAHAEGAITSAPGDWSHAEGALTIANGTYSHAEGCGTIASGDCSHAEGLRTTASGYSAHAEGCETIASGECSHVQGKYNIEDTNNKYAMIIGNGTTNVDRSNALTVDWNGNIECGKINDVNISNLQPRIAALETQLAGLETLLGNLL